MKAFDSLMEMVLTVDRHRTTLEKSPENVEKFAGAMEEIYRLWKVMDNKVKE